MCLIVCIYAGISRRNSFKEVECEAQEKHFFFFFFEKERIGNSFRDSTGKTLEISLDL